ncbi:DUF1090 domain-containing protein [Agarivorans sp. 1_MG-2023]|uniref:DUF1090 domain-containing protein n=1 Tax=Agarivorans sp. 1_MG-2023 TaxID=3062634 RepID=UPI0026E19771|nr:DUF1090 domain-containing protein [Agarivorans sp. 1_MG-2023]MDO6764668.1 DUF1090 domain-containing protein [Agarivorans sp. 1_MG-2023]
MFNPDIKILLFIPLLLLPLTVSASDCSEQIGCKRKACEIQSKITIAKANGHSDKLDGLNDALAQVSTHCTNDGLRDELLEKIEESQSDVDEYRSELDEAYTYNEEDKILKYQRKIEEEQHKINQNEKALSLLP